MTCSVLLRCKNNQNTEITIGRLLKRSIVCIFRTRRHCERKLKTDTWSNMAPYPPISDREEQIPDQETDACLVTSRYT